MLYDEERNRYCSDWDSALDYYYEEAADSETFIPEVLYETRLAEADDKEIEDLTDKVIDSIDCHMPEFSTEEQYSSEFLPKRDRDELESLIKNWLSSRSFTMVPDYNKSIPFRENFRETYKSLVYLDGGRVRSL